MLSEEVKNKSADPDVNDGLLYKFGSDTSIWLIGLLTCQGILNIAVRCDAKVGALSDLNLSGEVLKAQREAVCSQVKVAIK